jgi:chaperonin GroES
MKEQIQKMVEKAKNQPEVQNLLRHQLLQDNVLIAAAEFEKSGKVYRPNQYEDKPEFGVVLSVGQGRLLDNGTRVPSPVQVGDFVIFGKYSSVKVRAEGVDFLFVRDEDIMSKYIA